MTDLPPHDPQAEMALLGAFLLSSDMPDLGLTPEDFYGTTHRLLFGQILGLLASGAPLDPVLLAEGGADTGLISDCLNACATAEHASHYAEIVKGKATLRKLIQAGREIQQAALSGEEPEKCLDMAQQAVFALGQTRREKEPTVPETVDQVLQDIRESRPADFPFGIGLLDDGLGGMNRGEVLTVYGESSHCKSSLCLSLILESLEAGARVVMADYEMGRNLTYKRILSQLSGCSLSEITRRQVSPYMMGEIEKSAEKVKRFNLTYLHSPTLATVQATARRVKADIILYDYVQQATGLEGKKSENGDEVVTRIMGALKRLSLDIGAATFVVSQVVKDIPTSSRPRPKDIKASSAIFQSSDKLVCAFWPIKKGKEGVPADLFVVGIDKNKNGPTEDVVLQVDPKCARISQPTKRFSSSETQEATR